MAETEIRCSHGVAHQLPSLLQRRGATTRNLTTFAFGALLPTPQPEHHYLPEGRTAPSRSWVPLAERLPGHCRRPLGFAPSSPPTAPRTRLARGAAKPAPLRSSLGHRAPYGPARPPTGPAVFSTSACGCKGAALHSGEVACQKPGPGKQSKNRYQYVMSLALLPRRTVPPVYSDWGRGPFGRGSASRGRAHVKPLHLRAPPGRAGTPPGPSRRGRRTAGWGLGLGAGGWGERPGEPCKSQGRVQLFPPPPRPTLFFSFFLIFFQASGEPWSSMRGISTFPSPGFSFPGTKALSHTYYVPR
ncbi:protein transport protein SEC31-like isoform X1 [Sus scrofa]|uniref:protein transport protein SEC31-like isoform X1 n=1 Tax=Sus scrofa TaxID=9823 RepID=UPI000A2B5CE5|nr:protein transport protein SEC31-like isoform X1 [Sus scrofa]